MASYFVQLNELLDAILGYDFQPSTSFSDVEKAVGDLRNIWIRVELADCSSPIVNTVLEKMSQFIKKIRRIYWVTMQGQEEEKRCGNVMINLLSMQFNCTYINTGSN